MALGMVRHWKRWAAIGVIVAAAAFAGGPYVYIHFIQGQAPAPLALSSPSDSSSGRGAVAADSTADSGTWSIAEGSVVGYRVKEVLFGQSNEAVGRTSAITGSITVDGTTVTKGSFTVDMTTVASDETRRDAQLNGRIMETGLYPTGTFTLTAPIELKSVPTDGEGRTVKATGRLTLHGVTRMVTFTVTGRLSGSTVQAVGSIPVTFADYNIGNPSFGGVVTTEDHGVLEFSLNFTQT
jgi:polyisoprenoid-binding protein YceI